MKRLLAALILISLSLPALAQPGTSVVDGSGRLQRALDRLAFTVSGTTPTIDCRRPINRITLTGNTTLTLINYNPGANTHRTTLLAVTGNGTHTLTWPSSDPVCNGINGTITPGNTTTIYQLEWTGSVFVVSNPGAGGAGGGGIPDDGTVTDIKVAAGAAINISKIGGLQTSLDGKVLKAGDTMTGVLSIGPGTATANSPPLTLSQTWNSGAVSFEGLTLAITDTASLAGSYPIIARVGASPIFYARKDGLIFGSVSGQFGGSTVNGTSLQLSADGFVGRIGGTSGGNTAYGTTYVWTRSPGNLEFTLDSDNSDTTQTIRFARDSGTLGGGTTMTEWTQGGEFRFQNGSGSALLKVFSAFTDTLNGAWLGLDAQGASGRLRLGSEFNGTGTALPLDFRHGFGTAATLQTNGTFNFATVGVTNSLSTPELRSGNGTVVATLDNAGEMQIPSLQITNSVDSTSESLSGTSPAANWATQGIKTITLSGNTTFTFSNTPTGNGYVRSLAVKVLGNGSHTIAFPGTVDWQTSTIGTPRASDWTDYLFEYRDGTVYGYASDGGGLDADLTAVGNITGTGLIARAGDANWTNITTSAGVAAHITDETGTGAIVLATSPTITTPTISGAITFPDGVRQTFNPDGTAAGLNVGSQAGDPSSPTNGDLWYDSTANELTARINGANVALGAGGGSATYKPWDTNQYHLPSTTYHVGTATSVPVNTMRCIAFFSEAGGKLTNISFSVTTGGSAGSVARIGVYNATSANDRRPGTLVVGSGEIDTTTTGHKVATVDVTLDPQKWYLLAILTGTAAPTLASSDPAAAYTMGFDPVNNGPVTYYQVTQTYGALPANAPTGGTMVVSAAQPKMFVKFSQSP